ncbi:MAG: polyphosphate kinase 1 [Bacteroidota bacterium]|jgi:polyphosphate kinase
MNIKRTFNRDLSWLSFNHRVLQEAKDIRVPLYERMKFLAIFSSNLEEFYRIRVAEWKRLMELTKKTKKELKVDPREVILKINKTVKKHLQEFNSIFFKQIVVELEGRNIKLVNETMLQPDQIEFVQEYFREKVMPHIRPVMINTKRNTPELDEKSIYLAVKLCDTDRPGPRVYDYAITEIPSRKISRFLILPDKNGFHYVMILGDVIRLCMNEIFPDYELVEAYSIKLTRDAELMLEDEFSGSLLKKIKKGLTNRSKGTPTRLLYDSAMPADFLNHLKKIFEVGRMDLLPGGRYHNFSDLMNFPKFEQKGIYYEALSSLKKPTLDAATSMFDALSKRDFLLHFPYHSYDYVIRFLNEAADDPQVRAIKITLYRVAPHSKVVEALIKAAQNGKQVMAFVELKARFDEESNIGYSKELEEAGVNVLYSFPILKVHCKMVCIERMEDKLRRYVYLSTGNFHENTSKLYCDSSLLTKDKYMGREVSAVFDILADTRIKREFKHLLVAPDHMRHDLYTLIDQEIKNALKGKPAYIHLKLNSLQDQAIIDKLYEASQEGVEIKLIIRGICCLIPGVKDLSENIKVISIVDRFLEHSRIYVFCNNDQPKVYLSSADWMERNLSRRYEVGFPIYQEDLRNEILEIMRLQWRDNTKARIINKIQNNTYRKSVAKERGRSQMDIYHYLAEKGKQKDEIRNYQERPTTTVVSK